MFDRVRLVRFKRFADHTFDLRGRTILLAGPNNSGKTTLLHAISAWNLALTRWRSELGSRGARRKRISLHLDEFTALPLREMNLLWLNRHTARRLPSQMQPKPAPIYIQVFASKGERVEESLTMEFLYASNKLVYVRPVKSPDDPVPVEDLPEFAGESDAAVSVVHVPAFSGIATSEALHSAGMQAKLVGEGRPGEIVRNLLLQIWNESKQDPKKRPWSDLQNDVVQLFQCELLPPEFTETTPYIVAEYRPRARPAESTQRPPRLDVANAGSGFHQVLLLLAFFYSRKAAVLLLDEPDAHLHFILQREIFDLLRRVAQQRNCKLIIGTHSEVLLSSVEPDDIISFVSQTPGRLTSPAQKQQLQDALRQLSALDLLQADHVRAVMYVEDESDHKLLREWARLLRHPAEDFLKFPYLWLLRGRGNLDAARKHFQCLRLTQPTIRGICILDHDRQAVDVSAAPEGLTIRQWDRYEIESYLLSPNILSRYLRNGGSRRSLEEEVVLKEFSRNFPGDTNYLDDIPAIRDLKASDFIVNLLRRTSKPLEKRELYMLVDYMQPDEVHPAVRSMLDAVQAIVPAVVPSNEANMTPADPSGVEDDERDASTIES